jgi:NAD(P)-dependent dehydrogenase (short-subunit alcohol dehydrogenase family)
MTQPAGAPHTNSVVITGGASGIGRGVVLAAAAKGWQVAIIDRDADRLAAVASEATAAGAPTVTTALCDVRDDNAIKAAFAAIVEAFGSFNGLVCCAGIDAGGLLHEVDDEHWQRVIDTNLGGTYRACREALRHYLTNDHPNRSIVVISSAAAKLAIVGASSYSATKAGQLALVRNMAIDYARQGIRANAVLPGSTDTPLMWANVSPEDEPEIRRIIDIEIPIGRISQPSEQANAALWLLSAEASYVTGAELSCDGGLGVKCGVTV